MGPRRALAPVAAVLLMIGGAAATASIAGADDDRPTAAVSLGDSAASGEGARNYESGTDDPDVNQCHRSHDSYIHETRQSAFDATINLACSGADSANLYIDGGGQWGEANQAVRLADAAARYDVELVTIQVGANDDPAFGETVLECVLQWANPFEPGCRNTIGPEWPDRVEAMKPKVSQAVEDAREVMANAGYASTDYELVLLSYASPVTEEMAWYHAGEGCPIRPDDAEWGRTVAAPLMSEALRDVAQSSGIRFLDLSRATEGHEACNRHVPDSQEWVRPLTVRLEELVEGVDSYLVQESFHPNARGHDQMGRCLGEFYASGATDATCLEGGDGNLHPSG